MTDKDKSNVYANDAWSAKSLYMNKQLGQISEKGAGGKIQFMAKPEVASQPATTPTPADTQDSKKD